MHILVFGSHEIGYSAALELLDQGHSATLLLQDTSVFDNDRRMQLHVKFGGAQLVRGDVLIPGDVRYVWGKATDYGRAVDYVIFTMSAGLDMSFNNIQGLTTNPPNLLTKAILNVLCAIPDSVPRPKLIATTSVRVTKGSSFPDMFASRPMDTFHLRKLRLDELGLERVLAHGSGRQWDDTEPRDKITTVDGIKWQDRKGLPLFASLEVLVFRPEPSVALWDEIMENSGGNSNDVGGSQLSEPYTVSKEEVAHFIAETVVKNWNRYKGKVVTVCS